MKRMLSSRLTFFWKVIFPLTWSGGFALGTLYLWTHSVDSTGKAIPPWVKWQFLIMWLLGTAFILWITAPLKRVFRDNQFLYVSNFRTEVAVPLASIAIVRENRKLHVGGKHPIMVDLEAMSAFGQRIVFIPTGRTPLSWPWKPLPHPITTELQRVIEERNSSSLT